MKKNTFTIAAVAAAAIAVAPLLGQSVSTLAANDLYPVSTANTLVYQNGSLTATPNADAIIFDSNNIPTGQVIPAGANAVYTAIRTLNGEKYYQVGYNNYVRASDVAVITSNTSIYKPVTIETNSAIIYDELGFAVMPKGLPQKLTQGSQYVATEKRIVSGATYYKIGNGKFVKEVDITPSQNAGESTTSNAKMTGIVKINYVPGYSIQVWTRKHGFVTDNSGALKKLKHGTTWKVFGSTNINGEDYYNVGGNQYIDSAFVSIIG